jgi:pyruvyltransferase
MLLVMNTMNQPENKTIESFWYQQRGKGSRNVGDTLTPIIVEYFTGRKVELVDRDKEGKLLAIGSIMTAMKKKDVIWGTGVMRGSDKFEQAKHCKFLAVRGKLSERALGLNCGVYGDPALLLPIIYNPEITKKYDIGYIPHYIDHVEFFLQNTVGKNELFIDVEGDWKTVIEQIKSCRKVVSSSLHGIVIAEAYGIPAIWTEYSNKVIGGGFKFQDYLTGTGREISRGHGEFPPIKDLKAIQDKLIEVLQGYYGKSML